MFKKKQTRPYEVGDKVIVKEIKGMGADYYEHIKGWEATVLEVGDYALEVKFTAPDGRTPDYVRMSEVELVK